ncbi:hypothetical protein [uncultured Desulfovibrio sp.]|uniref:hypothetical protein n=1 Tax=uncultured Desulfovibrio sp. TaxID=167968 RepID=UPI002635C78B|nr:hypothetical protein [uncultured Desulfovibrio sp.]
MLKQVYRIHFICLAAVIASMAILSTAAIMIVIIYVDPLQVLHNQRSKVEYYYSQQRYRTAGLIRRHFLDDQDKETAIIGTSMMENTLARDVERLAGLPRAMNLSFGACLYGELGPVYRMLLKSPSLKHLIVGFMGKAYLGDYPGLWPDTPFPQALYRDNLPAKLVAMYHAGSLKMALEILLGCCKEATDLNMAGPWMSMSSREKLFSYFAHHYREEIRTQEPFKPFGGITPALHSYVENLLRTPEHIQVYVIINPFFLGYSLPFDLYEQGLRFILNSVKYKKNISIYAFDNVKNIVCNAANYKDVNHFGIGVNRYILRSIAARKHIITEDNIEKYLDEVKALKTSMPLYVDTTSTVAFEGPLDESLFFDSPLPEGRQPLIP